MPVLRLQLPCAPRRHRRGAVPRRLSRRACAFRGARARPHRHQHLLRRRHAVADAAAHGRGDPRGHRRVIGPSTATPRSRSRPIPPASRRRSSRAMPPPASTGCRSAVQALDDASLKALGRLHTADEALAALDLAHKHFGRVSFDLIYAREGQSAEAWAQELTRALEHAGDHLSLYQLTIEDGTPFAARHAAGTLHVPGATKASALYLLTQELCEAAGLPAYEISNHARPGAESRHNLLYWRGSRLCRHRRRRSCPHHRGPASSGRCPRSSRPRAGSPKSRRAAMASPATRR